MAITKINYLGEMYILSYNPENRKTMRYWDAQPCVFVIEKHRDGFLGINLHYYPINMRKPLFNALMKISKKIAGIQRLDPKIINQPTYRLCKPCIKKYKYSRIKDMRFIGDTEWYSTAMASKNSKVMPLFIKKNEKVVWAESRKKFLKET
jgi:hypothetical protein